MARHAVWGKGGDDYPFYDKLKFHLVLQIFKKFLHKNTPGGKIVVMDVGCGYDARVLQSLQNDMHHGIGLDFEVDPQLRECKNFTFHEGDLLQTIGQLEEHSIDFIVFLSILEHLENPLEVLTQARKLLRQNGRLFFCSPTWFGKWVLENVLSNRLFDPYGETPKQYNSHKMYYDPRDMWPLLVKAGFVSTDIKIWRSNFLCSISGYAEYSGKS